MSLAYEEFPSNLPDSMSDEEIDELKKQYKLCIAAKNAKAKQAKATEDAVKSANGENEKN